MRSQVRLAGGALIIFTVVSLMAAGWSYTGSMSQARESFGRAVLDTGQVLVCGGTYGLVTYTSCEIYSPASGTWSSTGSLNTARNSFSIVRLPDGRFLAAGGSPTSNGGVMSAAEVYDPITEQWTSVAPMNTARTSFGLLLLSNGKVFAVGGGVALILITQPPERLSEVVRA